MDTLERRGPPFAFDVQFPIRIIPCGRIVDVFADADMDLSILQRVIFGKSGMVALEKDEQG